MRKIFFLLIVSILGHPVFSLDKDPLDISDDSSLRRAMFSKWFNDPPVEVLQMRPYTTELDTGERVKISLQNNLDEFSIVLARELSGTFPGWAQGSIIVTRSKKNGALLRMRIFLRSDPYIYIQFHPDSKTSKTLFDAVAYDANIARSAVIPMPFARVITAPLREVLLSAQDQIPLKYYRFNADSYRDIRSLISKIRSKLPTLTFVDDGAIDENGNYVFIENLKNQSEGKGGLNCSGFSKWVLDGMLSSVSGKYLSITQLKKHTVNTDGNLRGGGFTEPYEDVRDPFFGLDWIRNLGLEASKIFRSPSFAGIEEIEVRNCPFSSTIVRGRNGGIRPYEGYMENAGFAFEGLQAMLYTLAIDEPGTIYLGAVNKDMMPKPIMRQFYHIAVFMPYFDQYGMFHIAVFESAVETAFNSFKARYPGNHINLVRIKAEADFYGI